MPMKRFALSTKWLLQISNSSNCFSLRCRYGAIWFIKGMPSWEFVGIKWGWAFWNFPGSPIYSGTLASSNRFILECRECLFSCIQEGPSSLLCYKLAISKKRTIWVLKGKPAACRRAMGAICFQSLFLILDPRLCWMFNCLSLLIRCQCFLSTSVSLSWLIGERWNRVCLSEGPQINPQSGRLGLWFSRQRGRKTPQGSPMLPWKLCAVSMSAVTWQHSPPPETEHGLARTPEMKWK